LEEFVDHFGEDRHELAPFENGQILISAEVEEPRAELET
jgi:hypothetical protein